MTLVAVQKQEAYSGLPVIIIFSLIVIFFCYYLSLTQNDLTVLGFKPSKSLTIENNNNINDNNTTSQQTPPSINQPSSIAPQSPSSESQAHSENVYDIERQQQPPSPFLTTREEEPGGVSGSGEPSSLTDEITKRLEQNEKLRQEVVEFQKQLEFLPSSPSFLSLVEEPTLDSFINKSALDRQTNELTPFSSTGSNSTKDSNGLSVKEISKMLAKLDL